MPSSIEGLLLWWLGWKFKKKVNQVWRALPAAILWSVWRYMNECVFQEVQPNFNDLCECIKIPFCVVCGWFLGHPMDLNFQLSETTTLFMTVLVVAFMLQGISPKHR
ncbi:hypothetical protein CsSME_00026770 [Camellia sinensis var. sinensis]